MSNHYFCVKIWLYKLVWKGIPFWTRGGKNEKNVDYNDCGFENEEIFEKVLKAIEQSGIIIQNNEININIINLNNYKINDNNCVEIGNRNKLVNWLKENAVQLLQTAIATIALFT